ncbi:autotransporter outer membrane beta-barrel domain-containing protein [Ahrensia marina]|uniref:autotransporter outer membrane beta-barrel domain-containing protein n=1 Tax=Ahrensia marina TaxID=1514904 RepID=UPI0035D05091
MPFLSKRWLACTSSLCLAVSALAVEAIVMPQYAHAQSFGCAALDGDSFTVTGNAPGGTGNFDFDPGEVVNVDITFGNGVNAVQVSFLGETQVIPTNGFGNTVRVSFTVPDTGGPSNGGVLIVVSSDNPGDQVGVALNCDSSGAAGEVDGVGSSAVVDAVTLDALPGGQSGSLSDAFGVNLSQGLFARAILLQRLGPRVEEFELQAELDALGEEIGEAQRERVLFIRAGLFPSPEFGVGDPDNPLSQDDVTQGLEERDARIEQLLIQFNELEDRLREVRAANNAAALNSSNFAPVSSGATEPTSAVGVLRNGFTQRVDLADVRRAVVARRVAHGFSDVDAPPTAQDLPGFLSDERFNAWLQASVTFHSVDGNGRDEDGSTVALAGGVSYLFGNAIEAGLVGRYARSQRDGTVADTDVDLWSLGAFAQTILDNGVSLQAVVAASFGDGSVVLDPAVTRAIGAFDVQAYQAQIRAARRFEQETWWIEPDASLTVTHMNRHGFAASDGTAIPETRSTRLTAALGPTVGTDVALDGGVTLSPYLGVTLFGTLVDQPDRNTPLASSDTSLGGGVRAGLQVVRQAGVTIGIDGSVNAFENEAFDATISARVAIPFGG